MSTPRRGPSQSSSCMCLGPRSYRTDSAPRLRLPLLSSPPPTPLNPPECSHSIRTLNEGRDAENTLAFNNQEAFATAIVLPGLPAHLSHRVCVFIVSLLLLPPRVTRTLHAARLTRRYTHSAFDSTETTRAEKQKNTGKWPWLLQRKS